MPYQSELLNIEICPKAFDLWKSLHSFQIVRELVSRLQTSYLRLVLGWPFSAEHLPNILLVIITYHISVYRLSYSNSNKIAKSSPQRFSPHNKASDIPKVGKNTLGIPGFFGVDFSWTPSRESFRDILWNNLMFPQKRSVNTQELGSVPMVSHRNGKTRLTQWVNPEVPPPTAKEEEPLANLGIFSISR